MCTAKPTRWPAKTQISMYIDQVCQVFLFISLWIAWSDLSLRWSDRTSLIVGFVVHWFICRTDIARTSPELPAKLRLNFALVFLYMSRNFWLTKTKLEYGSRWVLDTSDFDCFERTFFALYFNMFKIKRQKNLRFTRRNREPPRTSRYFIQSSRECSLVDNSRRSVRRVLKS